MFIDRHLFASLSDLKSRMALGELVVDGEVGSFKNFRRRQIRIAPTTRHGSGNYGDHEE